MRSLILLTVARGILPVSTLFALFLLLRGHNEPGGGFIAGLVTASAIVLQAIAFGTVRTRERLTPLLRPMAWVGLLIAAASGFIAMASGDPYLTHYHAYLPLPGGGAYQPLGHFVDVALQLRGAGDCGAYGARFGRDPGGGEVEWRDGPCSGLNGTGRRHREAMMADALKDRIRADLNQARRAKDRFRTTLLSTFLSEIRNKEIELGREAGDEDVIGVAARAIKQRKESAEQMRSGGRTELAEKEEAEAAVLVEYLPAAMPEADVRALVRDAIAGGADNMGAVMAAVMPRIKGRFDGREANRIVREELG
jgi:uncharacterized protein YqeY/multisubunit Na+/H+ antiporter MnhB subunit